MKWTRRDVIKGLGGLPIIGGIWWAGAANTILNSQERSEILEQLNIEPSLSPGLPLISGEPIKVGIVGFGIRGEQLCRALGFASKEWLENMKKAAEENPKHTALKNFLEQEKLNIQLVAVCDAFDVRAENVVNSFSTDDINVKRYKTHQEMIRSGNVDAIIIATPDHWHAPMAIDALENGVHVYVEKPCSHNMYENEQLVKASKYYNKVVQMGNQQRSSGHTIEIINEIPNEITSTLNQTVALYNQTRRQVTMQNRS